MKGCALWGEHDRLLEEDSYLYPSIKESTVSTSATGSDIKRRQTSLQVKEESGMSLKRSKRHGSSSVRKQDVLSKHGSIEKQSKRLHSSASVTEVPEY